jgi:hypothetical protein
VNSFGYSGDDVKFDIGPEIVHEPPRVSRLAALEPARPQG